MESHMTTPELQKARHERELRIQRQISFASGLFEGDVSIRTLLESLIEGVVVIDDSGTILLMNTAAVQMFGYQEKELIGKPQAVLIPERFRKNLEERQACYFAEPRTGPIKEHIALSCLHKDGRELYVEINLSFIQTIKGVLVISLISDITLRKQLESEIQNAREYAENIVETVREPMVVLNSDLKILTANHSFYDAFMVTPEATIGNFIYDLGNRQWDIPKLRVLFEEILPHNTVLNGYEVEHDFQDIGRKIILLNARQIFRKDIGSHIILLAMEDITERKQAEEEIERVNTELEAANLELEAFNYTVAHDLRNPLNIISSYCQVFKELCGDKLDEQCMHYIQETYDGALRMNRLIEALLQFSRMAHAELNRVWVDLSRIAKEVAEELKGSEAARRVEVQMADGLGVYGDASLLRVVLANLLGNAWKYTATQEDAVIEFGTKEIDGKQTCFVRDNGNGFNMADADKLFVPFQRLPGVEEFRGFGVGLATVERIIKRHGGKIWAEGEPGKGATFYFTLSADEAST
jgi:PAS domain S-box-containing protein